MATGELFRESQLLLTFSNAGLDLPEDLFAELDSAYGEPNRHYHNRSHVSECLTQFRRVAHLAQNPAEIELAIWFHDAVYDTRAGDNEDKSGELARRALADSAAPAPLIGRVAAMVLATKTHEREYTDAALMVDVDLGILGTNRDTFLSVTIRQSVVNTPGWSSRRTGRAARPC